MIRLIREVTQQSLPVPKTRVAARESRPNEEVRTCERVEMRSEEVVDVAHTPTLWRATDNIGTNRRRPRTRHGDGHTTGATSACLSQGDEAPECIQRGAFSCGGVHGVDHPTQAANVHRAEPPIDDGLDGTAPHRRHKPERASPTSIGVSPHESQPAGAVLVLGLVLVVFLRVLRCWRSEHFDLEPCASRCVLRSCGLQRVGS